MYVVKYSFSYMIVVLKNKISLLLSDFLILHNQQSSLTFRNLQQSANAKLVVVSLQCRKEQGGTDIKATAGRRK